VAERHPSWPRFRAGVNTGTAVVGVVGDGAQRDYTVLGDTVNVAARLQGAAKPGEILIAEATFTQVEKHFPNATRRELELKGKSERVIAWEIARTRHNSVAAERK
jgi:class 3 adenylate cyclase